MRQKKKRVRARKQIEMMFFYFDIELIELMKEVESAPYYMVIRTGSRYISKPPVETWVNQVKRYWLNRTGWPPSLFEHDDIPSQMK